MRGARSKLPRAAFLVAAVGIVLAASRCSAVVDPDTSTLRNPPPQPCKPGAIYEGCACEDGRLGTQTCNALERYEGCVCGDPAGGAGTTGGD
jgi:hypothetical protein